MVAKINTGANLYGAVFYNQKKVSEGTARVIGGNRMLHGMGGDTENAVQQTMFAFENYLLANKKTEKPILHISLNPAPEDNLTDGQCSELAKDYMDKLGYGDQPYMVYMHEDTGRRHIHIVSTCVKETGQKIDDSYIYKRSMNACRELEEKYGLKNIADKKEELTKAYLRKGNYKEGDVKRQVSNILKSVFTSYRFQTFGEYSALLACFNIEAKQVKGEHDGKPYNGIIYTMTNDKGKPVSPPFKSSLFDKKFGFEGVNKRIRYNASEFKKKKWEPKIRNHVALAMAGCGGKQKKFRNLLAAHGIGAVLRENEQGRIYGVTFIDHNSREVYNGSRLGKEFSANAFEKLFNGPGTSTQSAHHDYSGQSYNYHDEQASTIAEAFGIFELTPRDPDYEEEQFARRMKRKKKRKPGQKI